ncbi:MAG: hypothetical protein ACLP4V_17140 [Methylocella sp.]
MADAVTENLSPAPLPRHQIGKDPEHFTNQNAQADRDLSDQIGLTAAIENAFAEGRTARQVQSTLAGRLNFLPETERAIFVANVRATLGIPSRATADGEAEFQAWAAERTARDAARDSEPAAEGVDAGPNQSNEALTPAPSAAIADLAEAQVAHSETPPAPSTPPPSLDQTSLMTSSDANKLAPIPLAAQPRPPERPGTAAEQIAAFGDDGPGETQATATVPVFPGNNDPKLGLADAATVHASATPLNSNMPDRIDMELEANEPATPVASQQAEPSARRRQASPQANIGFYGPGAALGGLLASMRKTKPEEAPKSTAGQTNLVGQAATYEQNRMQPRRDEAVLDTVKAAGKNTLQSLKALEDNKDMTLILNRINSAAKQAGMAAVIEEMRPGGKYADLRKQFNVALDENTHIKNDYENANNNLNAYADQRAEIKEILKARPQARKDFEELDQDIAKGFFGLPGKEAGKSALDEATDKVKEVLESAVNAVRNAFGRKADQTATTRFAPGPSLGP